MKSKRIITPEQEIVLQARKQYASANGTVSWKRALAENPGWRHALQYDNETEPRSFKKAYNRIASLKNSGVMDSATPAKRKKTPQYVLDNLKVARAVRSANLRKAKKLGKTHEDVAMLDAVTPTVEKMLKERVQIAIERILVENGFCSKCGKSHLLQFTDALNSINA